MDKIIEDDFSSVRELALTTRAVNHPLRQKLIKTIRAKVSPCVRDLYVALRIEQSVASQHLRVLARAGIVTDTREGKFIYYSLNEDRLAKVIEASKVLKK